MNDYLGNSEGCCEGVRSESDDDRLLRGVNGRTKVKMKERHDGRVLWCRDPSCRVSDLQLGSGLAYSARGTVLE